MSEPLFLNGEFLTIEQGRVSIEDRGFLFADGVYEAIRVYKGKPFTLREHLERFLQSAAGLEIPLAYTLDQLDTICRDLIARTDFEQATIYMQLTRGAARRAHAFPEKPQPTLMAFARRLKPLDSATRQEGVRAISLPDERWNRCHLKTIALLPNVLASEQAHRVGANEAILFAPDGTVFEGASSNVHCVRDGLLWTHPLSHKILPGVTRQRMLVLAARMGIPVREEPVKLKDLKSADEVFLTSITREILGVRQIDDTPIGMGRTGPVTLRLHKAFLELAARECGLESCY